MSRDPDDHKLRDARGMPIDPKYLHKYLYGGWPRSQGTVINLKSGCPMSGVSDMGDHEPHKEL
jgi:hypothetical protein